MLKICDGEKLVGERLYLRLVTLSDCNATYESWLNDELVNQFLETRWHKQDQTAIKAFVEAQRQDPSVYLFAMVLQDTHQHIGNIKLGPINPYHASADISYFIGDKAQWGKGLISEAIELLVTFSFEELKLHSLWAGAYQDNVGSQKALERNGFRLMGKMEHKLKSHCGWEDQYLYGRLRGGS